MASLIEFGVRCRSAKEAVIQKTRLQIFVFVACPFVLFPSALAGTLDGRRPIPGAAPGTIDVAELLPACTDSGISLLTNSDGIRCGAVGPLLPLFVVAVLMLYGMPFCCHRRIRSSFARRALVSSYRH